jgi:branched-chain amino acid transport system ATP-binding protein
MLELRHVSKQFGGLKAIWDLSFRVEKGDFLGVIGPNGAGKTTLLNLITGYQKPGAGTILFKGQPIHALPPFRVARLGIGRTFQVVRPFGEMSVEENVAAAALFSAKSRIGVAEGRARARVPLELTGLWPVRDQLAGTLTIGGKKKLELARALAVQPELLLLDEVMGGLSGPEITDIVEVLERIHGAGVTILMIEHVVEVILRLTGRVVVLNFGEKLFEGTPQEVVEHPAVIETYLGRPLEAAYGPADAPAAGVASG